MFSHSCNGTNIFIRWKMKCTIQLGFASLNGTFHLSPQAHENICTIALINIHYLYTMQVCNSLWIIANNSRNVCLSQIRENIFPRKSVLIQYITVPDWGVSKLKILWFQTRKTEDTSFHVSHRHSAASYLSVVSDQHTSHTSMHVALKK